jgi:PTS system fructose-specific IIC component
VHLLRLLRPNLVLYELQSALRPPDVVEHEALAERAADHGRPAPDPIVVDDHVRLQRKEAVVRELAGLFYESGEIRNLSKFTRDLMDRERKSSTAVGGGLAVPHVRSMQPRKLVVVLARSAVGAEYLADGGEPVHVFLGIAAPSYDDADYWKLYRWLANTFNQETWLTQAILDAEDENDIVHLIKGLR